MNDINRQILLLQNKLKIREKLFVIFLILCFIYCIIGVIFNIKFMMVLISALIFGAFYSIDLYFIDLKFSDILYHTHTSEFKNYKNSNPYLFISRYSALGFVSSQFYITKDKSSADLVNRIKRYWFKSFLVFFGVMGLNFLAIFIIFILQIIN